MRAMKKSLEERYPTWDAFSFDLAETFRNEHLEEARERVVLEAQPQQIPATDGPDKHHAGIGIAGLQSQADRRAGQGPRPGSSRTTTPSAASPAGA